MGLRGKFSLVLLLLFGSLFPFSPVRAETPLVGAIAKELICQCGCTAVLSNCTHGECMVRDTMLTLIEQKLAQGQSQEQIIQFFVGQYGEQVLASPPKRGFNLVAWVTPFVAILLGAGVIFIAVRKWVKRGGQTVVVTEVGEEDEKYRLQLERELKEFTEKGFR